MRTSFTVHFDAWCHYALCCLLARRMGIRYPVRHPISQVTGIDPVVHKLLQQRGLTTVGDILEAYCLHHEVPGIGEVRWEHIFNCISS